MFVCFFFFSSRRRHTRFDCDWSSDVCSSDLREAPFRIFPWKNLSECRTGILASGYWLLQFRRSEEHTSELQSQSNLVCRLLLEKKKKNYHTSNLIIATLLCDARTSI